MEDVIRIGFVSSINPGAGTVQITYQDRDRMVTGDMPVLAFGGEYDIPEVNDMVLVAHLSNDLASGIVIGRFWNDSMLPKEQDWYKRIGPDILLKKEGEILEIRAPERRMKIGALGNQVVFCVSDQKVLTFRNLKREVKGNWSSMDRIGQKPLPFFQGPGLQGMKMEIVLDASLGIKPRKILRQIEQMVEKGQAETLIIGRKRIGNGKWVVTESSETWNVILQKGELYRATLSLTLQEYR